jgi:microcin C transport system ATP-binding protein
MSLLTVKDLSVSFHVGDRVVEAVKKASFTIEKGKTFALVGESGAGKSVTALSILDLLPPGKAFYPSGSILFKGRELMGASDELMREIRGNDISMIFQEPMTSLNPLHNIEKQVGEILLLHQDDSKEHMREKVVELLHVVQLSEAENRLNAFPHQLSGGQRQRVMIAMALANNPELLIADEPTTALDVTIQAEILELLKSLQTRFHMSMLLITHDLFVVRRMVDFVGVMKDGEIVECGEIKKVFQNPSHKYTKYLLASELKEGAESPAKSKNEVLSTKNLSVAFPILKGVFRKTKGYIHAVNDVSLKIREGHTVGLVGESGSGKTTFGLAILRLIASSGSILFQGKEIQGLASKDTRSLRKEMQIIFQDPFESLNPRLTVGQIIQEGIQVHKLVATKEKRDDLIQSVLEEVGLEPEMINRYPHEFSGGQRQRICIARALVLKPRFLILDEPTSALDMSIQTQVLGLLRDLQKRYKLAYLFISHDLRVVRSMSHEILVIKNGDIVEYGPSEKIFKKPKQPYTKALLEAAFDESVIAS